MIRSLIFLMTIVLTGFFWSNLGWAGNSDVQSAATTLLMPEAEAPSSVPTMRATHEAGYLIGPGDVIDVAVWKDENLTRSCIVRPDGFISFPLIGEIQAAERTVSQLKSEIEGKLLVYVPDVTLSLEVKQINSFIIYVIGKVKSPGRFVLNVDTSVLQALATAGGLDIYASRNKIKILRQGTGKTTTYPFEYDEVITGKQLEQNIYLRRGDVVVVP